MNNLQPEPTVKMSYEQVINYFNDEIKKAEVFLCLARSSHLQLEQCFALDNLIKIATKLKLEAMHQQYERDANFFLGYESVIGAVRSELMMWILLKLDMPNEAWDQNVAAQMGYLDASRADKGFGNAQKGKQKLESLEDKLFPPQSYVSAGFVADKIDCTICGERYAKCEHLRGKAYMGQFCDVIHRNPRGDHVALVDTPADKRCRVISFKTKDGHQDKLSWQITPFEKGEVFSEEGALEVKCNILNLDRYPYLASTEQIIGDKIPLVNSKIV